MARILRKTKENELRQIYDKQIYGVDVDRGIECLELAKQLTCEKQIIVGYRDANTFLKEQFEENGALYISTEDGSVGTKGNVMNAIFENHLEADIIYACGPTPMLRAIKNYAEENGIECFVPKFEYSSKKTNLLFRRLSRS